MHKFTTLIIALLIFVSSTTVFSAGSTFGPHQGTLLHFMSVVKSSDNPIKWAMPVSIHLDNGTIVTGQIRYNEKADRYDIRTIAVYSSDKSDKVNEELAWGYVVSEDGSLGVPARTKGLWLGKDSMGDPRVKVFFSTASTSLFEKSTSGEYVGTRKGTMLHWLPMGSGSTTDPAPATIRLEDGSLVFGDAVYNEKTNCHEISVVAVARADKDGKLHRKPEMGYVLGGQDKLCSNGVGVYAAVARFTNEPTLRDNVSVVFGTGKPVNLLEERH